MERMSDITGLFHITAKKIVCDCCQESFFPTGKRRSLLFSSALACQPATDNVARPVWLRTHVDNTRKEAVEQLAALVRSDRTDHCDQIAGPAAPQQSDQLRQQTGPKGLLPDIQVDVSPHRNACILPFREQRGDTFALPDLLRGQPFIRACQPN